MTLSAVKLVQIVQHTDVDRLINQEPNTLRYHYYLHRYASYRKTA